MAWKCPQCRETNNNDRKKCACGYAFYDVLGLKEDATAQSVEQTYKYLLKVWKTPAETQGAGARGKLDERIKKINDAHAVFKQINAGTGSSAGKLPLPKIAIGAGAAIVVIAAIIFLVVANRQPAQQAASPVSPSGPAAASENNATAQSSQAAPVQPAQQQGTAERASDSPDMNADKTPDWAIESVKKSHVLDRSATVDALVNKWTKENADRLKAIGWIARKADEKAYLVSYTATDGVTPTGFYFEINVETGEIRNIAGNAELQQKYGIKGN